MAAPIVNGEVAPSSAFLKHVTSYPIVSDSMNAYSSHPYGSKSIQLTDSAYQKFAAPVLPYFSKPYQYVKPYVKRADSLGDAALSKVDERVPILMKPTGEIYNETKGMLFYPLQQGFAGRDHVMKVYSSECKKSSPGAGSSATNGSGARTASADLATHGKAMIQTAIILTVQSLQMIGDYMGKARAKTHDAINEKKTS